jgi:hypothetical protein
MNSVCAVGSLGGGCGFLLWKWWTITLASSSDARNPKAMSSMKIVGLSTWFSASVVCAVVAVWFSASDVIGVVRSALLVCDGHGVHAVESREQIVESTSGRSFASSAEHTLHDVLAGF